LALGCVKAPAVEFPQVGPYLEHKTHLRESQPRGFDAPQDQLLKHFRYIPVLPPTKILLLREKGGDHRPPLMSLENVRLKITSQDTTRCRSLGRAHRAS
jgi:hypothetical protein